jgi:hypothetical protein
MLFFYKIWRFFLSRFFISFRISSWSFSWFICLLIQKKLFGGVLVTLVGGTFISFTKKKYYILCDIVNLILVIAEKPQNRTTKLVSFSEPVRSRHTKFLVLFLILSSPKFFVSDDRLFKPISRHVLTNRMNLTTNNFKIILKLS